MHNFSPFPGGGNGWCSLIGTLLCFYKETKLDMLRAFFFFFFLNSPKLSQLSGCDPDSGGEEDGRMIGPA